MYEFTEYGNPFGFMSIMFPIVFVMAFGIIIAVFIKSIIQWNKNNHSPRLIVDATIVSKRTHTSHHHHDSNMSMSHMHSTTTYYVTFQFESGDRMEFMMNGQEYGMLAEGDVGRLTFQGTRYLGFER